MKLLLKAEVAKERRTAAAAAALHRGRVSRVNKTGEFGRETGGRLHVFNVCRHSPRMRRLRRSYSTGAIGAPHAHFYAHLFVAVAVWLNNLHKPASNIALGTLISKLSVRRQVMEQLLTTHSV